MDIAVFGLGYVGCVSAACLAQEGHNVIGVDIAQPKVEMINSGRCPIIEPDLENLIASAVNSGKLFATTNVLDAIQRSNVSLICVGTPSHSNGSLDLTFVKNVCKQIGSALKSKNEYHLVVIRSTMLPGTVEGIVVPILQESSGKRIGDNFDVCVNPEFLREGSSLRDFYDPPFTLIGAESEFAADMVLQLYTSLHAPYYVLSLRAAEMIKYACNSFHALKVGFANEIGNLCKAHNIDSHIVMDVFCKDEKLNLSPYYLKPGFAFGGSCLPKDLRALLHRAKDMDLDLPLLSSILPSNRLQVERTVELVLQCGKKRIGMLGLSFKAGTDDLRESPIVALIEALLGKGMQLAVYDRNVALAQIFGANKQYIEHVIPHISRLMRGTVDEVLEVSDVVVVGNRAEEFENIEERLRPKQTIIDLVRLFEGRRTGDHYLGLCW